ncbi:TonB-dependent receptor plug domain-containing protein [Nannocystis radixulma]|uniref:TonB-dependent receptor n=1 Tax=Nannocystis radixulma TaxID=2995305 RepID=A0ABT5B635_9BACT|nr:TonB-dependent receptor [Nannocystis radixulma]MDC0669551.1 TonB-dependent receptor [Nannocystis radixulma]
MLRNITARALDALGVAADQFEISFQYPPALLVLLMLLTATTAQGAPPSAARPVVRPPKESKTVVVTSARTEQAIGDVAVSTRVVDRAAIEASGAETLAGVLEEQPGLQILRSFAGAGGVGIQMQGLDAKYVLILVDGQRATGRVGGVIDLSRFPAEDIAQVEIVKGPGSSLYGADAIAGVINIITRRAARKFEFDARARYGSFHTSDLSTTIGGARGRWSTRWSAGWHYTAGFDRDRSTPSTTGSAGHSFNASQRTDVRVRRDVTIGLMADYQRRDLHGIDSNAAGAVFDRNNLTQTTSVTLLPEITWDAPARLKLIGHLAHFDDNYVLDQRKSDALDQRQHTKDTLGQFGAQYDHMIAGRHLFSAGIETQLEYLSTPRLATAASDRQRFALYAQDEWKVALKPLVVVVPGARLDLDSQFGGYGSPRLAVRIDPAEALTLRASAGLGFRAPAFRELYLAFANPAAGYRVTGNPDLKAETARSATAGVAWRLSPGRTLTVDYFHHRLKDLIALDATTLSLGSDNAFQYINVGAARSQGVEAALALKFTDVIDAEVSYTLTDARDLELKRRLPGRPMHHSSARVRWKHPRSGTSAQLRAAVFGKQFYYADNDGDGVEEPLRVAPYANVDLRVAQEILGGRMTFFLGVDNLLNAGDAAYLPLVPRLFYGGISARIRSDLPKRTRKP